MLKILPIIYSFQHFPKRLPIILILFSNHYLLFPHYSLALLFQVVAHPEKQRANIHFVVGIV